MMTTQKESKTLTPAELDELEALEAKAFCAPWVARSFAIECPCPNGQHCGDSHTCEEVNAPEEYPWSPDAPADPDAENAGQCIVQIDVPGLEDFAKANAALIVAMRNRLPALIAAARRELSHGDHTQRDQDSMVLHTAIVRAEAAEAELTAATARAEAADARAQAAEKRCGELEGEHPWGAFLAARMRVLQWLRDEMHETPEATVRTMLMDPAQVRLILVFADALAAAKLGGG